MMARGSPAGTAVEVFPTSQWTTASPASLDLDQPTLEAARAYALSAGGSGLIVRHGQVALQWGDLKKRYDLKSTTKSFGAAALGLALLDGKVTLEMRARSVHPALGLPPETNRARGWLEDVTLFHLATQTAGFEKPGGFTPLLFQPGTQWDYSDSGPNWLAECLTLVYRRDLDELMFERVFTPIGITRADLVWRKNAYRPEFLEGLKRREFGAGISANVEAMARFGLLHLREGRWQGRQLLPRSFVEMVGRTPAQVRGLPVRKPEDYGRASQHYGLLWWNNNDGTLPRVPRDAFWSWGLYDSLIVIIPSLDLVVARAGQSWPRQPKSDHYAVLRPFLEPIADAGRTRSATAEPGSAVPDSPIIKTIRWDSADTIVRRARGSDNWPLSWADDDHLYTAYGDGNGFEPFVERKLSLGLARLEGDARSFRGINLRAPSLEQLGPGAAGLKASGLLSVEGVLYLWARNATNARLAWSTNHGAHWLWADWKFTHSFGCPSFLNYGRDYAGARDGFVYVYSHDADSAYQRADRFVLARVPKERIRERDRYEFFVRADGPAAVWSRALAERGAVLARPGRCYRSSVSYHSGLRRYLWCQTGLGEDTRFAGGFSIYDAPEPWGPWTVAFAAEAWDVGPGESMHLPTKWMSDDGRIVHLVFSGDDSFSVRRGTIVLR